MAGKKELIMASASKLLEKYSYKEISVLDIVSDSGVNRNTFYYHFKDMPALVEELACRQVDRIFYNGQLSMEDKLRALVDCLYENRRSVMHVYNFADRALFDKGLYSLSEHIVKRVFADRADVEDMAREELICVSCVFGLASTLLLKGLPENERARVMELCCESLLNIS